MTCDTEKELAQTYVNLNTDKHIMLTAYSRSRPYSENESEPYNIGFVNVKDLLATFFLRFKHRDQRVANWRNFCVGVYSVFGVSSLHLPMFDYDGHSRHKVIGHVKSLQRKEKLGPAWIYKTKRGFHAYFFCDAIEWRTYSDMLSSEEVCAGFAKCSINRGAAILRISSKYTQHDINLDCIVGEENGKRLHYFGQTIKAILEIGEIEKAHLAKLFPEQARYVEDVNEWQPPKKKAKAKESAEPIEEALVKVNKVNKYMKLYNAGVTNMLYSYTINTDSSNS